MLSKEELMKPRYKVIAAYPYCPYEEGTILYVDKEQELYSPPYGYPLIKHSITVDIALKYEKIFKRLHWSDERKPEDLPEYIKSINTGIFYNVSLDNDDKDLFAIIGKKNWVMKSCTVPATKEEYDQQNKSAAATPPA